MIRALLLCLSFSIMGCSKYPQDEFISLLTPEQRLAANPWQVQQLFVNGVDSTILYQQNPRGVFKLTFSKNSKRELTGFTDSYDGWGGAAIRKNGLEIQYFLDCSKGTCSYYNVFRPGYAIWKISKLFKNELILINQINGKIYEIYFTSK